MLVHLNTRTTIPVDRESFTSLSHQASVDARTLIGITVDSALGGLRNDTLIQTDTSACMYVAHSLFNAPSPSKVQRQPHTKALAGFGYVSRYGEFQLTAEFIRTKNHLAEAPEIPELSKTLNFTSHLKTTIRVTLSFWSSLAMSIELLSNDHSPINFYSIPAMHSFLFILIYSHPSGLCSACLVVLG